MTLTNTIKGIYVIYPLLLIKTNNFWYMQSLPILWRRKTKNIFLLRNSKQFLFSGHTLHHHSVKISCLNITIFHFWYISQYFQAITFSKAMSLHDTGYYASPKIPSLYYLWITVHSLEIWWNWFPIAFPWFGIQKFPSYYLLNYRQIQKLSEVEKSIICT